MSYNLFNAHLASGAFLSKLFMCHYLSECWKEKHRDTYLQLNTQNNKTTKEVIAVFSTRWIQMAADYAGSEIG